MAKKNFISSGASQLVADSPATNLVNMATAHATEPETTVKRKQHTDSDVRERKRVISTSEVGTLDIPEGWSLQVVKNAKTRRVQLLLTQDCYLKAKERAEKKGISFNEFASRALAAYSSDN